MLDKKDWYETVLKHVPNGEEGYLELLFDDAMDLSKILLKNDYAVMITNGDLDGYLRVSWIFYDPEMGADVCFTSNNYIADYPDAVLFELQEK